MKEYDKVVKEAEDGAEEEKIRRQNARKEKAEESGEDKKKTKKSKGK